MKKPDTNPVKIRALSFIFLFATILFFPLLNGNSTPMAKKPNFTGTWTLNDSKSEFGEYGRMWASQKMVIVQKGKSLSIERFSAGPSGEEFRVLENYTIDGKECMNTIFEQSTKKSTVNWAKDKSSMTIDSMLDLQFNGQQMEIKSIEIFSMEDGSLKIKGTSSSSYGESSVVFVYDNAQV